MAFYRRRPRPLWRSLLDLAGFLIVLTATLYLMQQLGMVDLGSSPVEVVDGDSLRREGQEIRLQGIDAPEYRQTCLDAQGKDYACGRQAREALLSIIGRRDVHCVSTETDRYGRAVSDCSVGEVNVARTMVQQGWALAYHGVRYAREEAEARKARRGLWGGTFERPSAYRERQRAIEGNAGAGFGSAAGAED